ncbi:MAG: response regulator, partial [Burkholderiaceae bacterium]|nr:response regulator [Burkholderiaceae bacterium]
DVASARGGREALAAIAQAHAAGTPFDVVVTDWKMPGMNGVELATQVRALALQPSPRVVVVTSFNRDEVVKACLQAGAVRVLVKPVSASTLFDTLADSLAQRRADEGAPVLRRSIGEVAPLLKGARVLLVEDNAVNREVAVGLLEQRGVVMDVAGDGAVALDMLRRAPAGRWTAVLMDMQMPVMDGLAATREIRKMLRHRSLPIIAMTANALEGDRQLCLAAGMNDYIPKPIDERVLLSVLARWVERSQALAAADEGDPHGEQLEAVDSEFGFGAGQRTEVDVLLPEGGAPDVAAAIAADTGLLAALETLDSAAAHEVRSSLGMISGYGTLLQRKYADELRGVVADHVNDMRETAMDTAGFVTAWREAARELRAPLEFGPLDLDTLVTSAVREFSDSGPADVRVAPGLPRAWGDARAVRRVLGELLSHARRATAPGQAASVVIDATRAGGCVVLTLTDAVALPEKARQQLFKPAARDAHDDAPGLELGLFVAHALAARVGGRLAIDEGAAAGTRFVLSLPEGQAQAPQA